MSLESYFSPFRRHIINPAEGAAFVYADWTASGRLYEPIESFITQQLGPFVGNTHTESTLTGTAMTQAYHEAQKILKRHVNGGEDDVILCQGSGMTSVINKLQRILGLRLPDKWQGQIDIKEDDKPIVFVTHMEHHSNQTTWNTCDVTVKVIKADPRGYPDLAHLEDLLTEYQHRPLKIGAFTACSNVTGIVTSYHELAKVMHQHGGLCFVDFAASAPYVDINMHPDDPMEKLDAIFFSPHKFLGGPGSSGVVVFDKRLYECKVPDQPGGGTVSWTNPWGEHRFFDSIEAREDGGTPGFLQVIKAALAVKLKEDMSVEKIKARERELTDKLMDGLSEHPKIHILEPNNRQRITIVSFYVADIHYNLIVKILNDRFGIQVRGGCSCAGTYGHILLGVDQQRSSDITNKIDAGDLSEKPGWVRVSLHPTTTNEEAEYVIKAIKETIDHIEHWKSDYQFDTATGEYRCSNNTTEYPTLSDYKSLP